MKIQVIVTLEPDTEGSHMVTFESKNHRRLSDYDRNLRDEARLAQDALPAVADDVKGWLDARLEPKP